MPSPSPPLPPGRQVKLGWMNGQYLRALPEDQALELVAKRLVDAKVVRNAGTPFVTAVSKIVRNSLVGGWVGGCSQVFHSLHLPPSSPLFAVERLASLNQ